MTISCISVIQGKTRVRTLLAALEISWKKSSEREMSVMEKIGIFVGGELKNGGSLFGFSLHH